MCTTLISEMLTVTVSDKGAELSSVKDKAGVEFLWQANPDVWPRHAPVLFPVVGKLKNNSFSVKHVSYSMAQHGFARDFIFNRIEHSTQHCVFELKSNEETKRIFPFDFIFRIKYALTDNVLKSYYTIINPGSDAMLFSVGAHPGFNCPLEVNESFEDYYLQFENNHYELTLLSDGLRKHSKKYLELTNNQLALTQTLFDKDALVFENNQINSISLCSTKSSHKIKLSCAQWPYFGIWSKKGANNFVCLEPWYGIADHENSNGIFSEKDGIIKLEPKGEFNCSFGLEFL